MKNSTISKISTNKSGYPRSRFNLSHDVNTTCAWSDCQPLMCRAMLPDSKATCGIESLVRLAPMVSPTFGDARFKTYHEFVAMSDLIRNFDAMMSQTRVNRGDSSFVPQGVPTAFLFDVSCMALIGSHLTVYRNGDGAKFDSTHPWKTFTGASDMSTLLTNLQTDLAAATGITSYPYSNALFNASEAFYGADDCYKFNPLCLMPERFLQTWPYRENVWIPVNQGNSLPGTSMALSLGAPANTYDYGQGVTLEDADVIVFREWNSVGYAFAFRLSDFGKRIRKALIGCGYQLNFDTDQTVSLMPLFATHKAWYELFGLQLFDNYEDTFANKILQRYDNDNVWTYSLCASQLNTHLQDFFGFFKELGSLWYTEKTDFVNAHTANLTSNVKDARLGTFIDVYGASSGIQPASSNLYGPLDNIGVDSSDVDKNGHVRTITQNHGQLDSELLKRLYKWTNRNSIAGQRVRDLLIQQGLADYVDECEPRFIGYDDTHINISDVVSTSDTNGIANPDAGAVLGEYGGRGLQYVDSKQFTYEAKEYGYWVVLAVVVPEAGYCQALDGNVLSRTKADFYQPEFDGLGMEANSKFLVCADSPIANPKLVNDDETLKANFGFLPQYSKLKVASNKVNGDFNLRSVSANYEPYTLDRLFKVNDKAISSAVTTSERASLVHEKFAAKDFPIAGNIWRYIGRYKFLTNFNRIFAQITGNSKIYDEEITQVDLSSELQTCQSDNFLVHNIIHMDYFAPMLPIEDSFETLDEGNDGKANSKLEKA